MAVARPDFSTGDAMIAGFGKAALKSATIDNGEAHQ